ncbi:MAG: peptide deformylase [Planctomycetota bacterium]
MNLPAPDSFQIVSYPHPALRVPAKALQRVDATLLAVARRMLDLMYDAKGVGLAANQIGLPIRLFVANPSGDPADGEELILINPVLQFPKGSDTAQEGCLSLPGVHADVKRPKKIELSGYDLSGQEVCRKVDGFLARILQHELDHLDGVMFVDRLSEESRAEVEGLLGELESDFRAKQRAGEIESDDDLVASFQPWLDAYTT